MEGDVIFNKGDKPQGQNPVLPEVPKMTAVPPPPINAVTPQAVGPSASPNTLPPPPPKKGFPVGLVIKILVGLLALVLVFFAVRFALSFFSGGTSNKEVTLTYWGLWESKEVMDVLIKDFEKENPKIKVIYVKQDIKQYRERLETRIKNGKGPDIFRFHNSWVPMLQGVELAPLSSTVMSTADFRKTYYPVIQKDLIKNGAIYGIPLSIDTLALFVNTEIQEAAGVTVPKTWDDFIKASSLMTVKTDKTRIETSGAAMGTFDNITHAPDILAMLLAQNGADEKKLSRTSGNAVEALDFYTSFASGSNVWDDTIEDSRLFFAKGKLAMYFGYSWDVFAIQALNPDLKFKIYNVPGLPKRNMTVASYWVEGVSSKSKFQPEAQLFMKYLAQKSTAQKFYTTTAKTRAFGEPYARMDLKESLKSNETVYPFVEQADTAVSSFFVSDTFDTALNNQMNAYLGNAVNGANGSVSSKTAIETLTSGIDKVLQQYAK